MRAASFPHLKAYMPIIYKKDKSDTADSGMDSKDGMAKDDSDDSASCLIPKSVIQNKKVSPGDKLVLEVVHIYEDEVEVKYGKDKKDKDKSDDDSDDSKEESAGSQMDMSEQQLSGLMDE